MTSRVMLWMLLLSESMAEAVKKTRGDCGRCFVGDRAECLVDVAGGVPGNSSAMSDGMSSSEQCSAVVWQSNCEAKWQGGVVQIQWPGKEEAEKTMPRLYSHAYTLSAYASHTTHNSF